MTKEPRKSELELLISSYIDGELTVSQSETVEKIIEEDSQAKEIFEQLLQVNRMIKKLPRVAAPPDLAESISLEIERDALLSASEFQSDIQGRNHLRFRKFVTAAAVLILTGAIVMIVYTVLFQSPTSPVKRSSEPLVAKYIK